MHDLLKFVGTNWWWLIWVVPSVLGSVAEWVGDQFGIGLAARRRKLKEKRKHELAMKKMDLELARAKQLPDVTEPGEPKPGECVHRRITPVIAGDEVVAWLCKGCDTQLPATWAVRKEDLQ